MHNLNHMIPKTTGQDGRRGKRAGWPKRFGLLYSLVLAGFTTYVLLDTFVIPREITAAASAVTASSTQSVSQADGVAESQTEAAEENGNNLSHHNTTHSKTHSTTAAASSAADDTASLDSNDDNDSSGKNETDGSATSAANAAAAVVTDTSYQDDNISISYTTERIDNTTCYIVDVQISDISYLQAALAQNTYGRNIKETTSAMAQEHNAILAINGDYYGFRDYGYVIRNGVLYRSTSGNDEDLVIDADGTMRIIREDEVSAEELEEEGVWQVLSFGPGLVENGEITVGTNEEVDQAMTSNPRTAIGMISPLHYIIIVSDGRTSESEGLTLYQLAQVFQEKGAQVAYNLDGGGSSTLYFNGKVINKTTGGAHGSSERRVSDILYIGE